MLQPILRSYSMLFFSQHRGLAGLLLLASFAHPVAGAAGLGAAALAVGGARLLGARRDWIDLGAYSFNALLVGLALPLYFGPGWALVGLVAVGAGLALLLSVALGGWLAGRGLPFLSLPFVGTMWLLLLASPRLPHLLPPEAIGTYWLNHAYTLGGPPLAAATRWVSETDWPPLPAAYLRALAAVLLQDSPWAGLLVAAGLLWHSRISFSLSVLAMAATWGLAALTGASTDAYDLGANYLMGAIAVGAVFAVPSAGSYGLALLSLPITAVLLAAADNLLRSTGATGALSHLPTLSLPYCGTALLLLWVLLLREKPGRYLTLTPWQHYSPEANRYAQLAAAGQPTPLPDYLPLSLPFLGEWRCTQGYADGGPTHQGPWGQALDFVVTDAQGRTYQGSGLGVRDYYCYDKPVLAPADGVVETVVEHLPDNAVGEVDTRHNWGNTVVLRHRPGLYSQLSHLRAHSVRVRPGQAVRRGEVLASCGNSGRSPEPHLHFQVQASPAVGAPTLPYPLAAYLSQPAPDTWLATMAAETAALLEGPPIQDDSGPAMAPTATQTEASVPRPATSPPKRKTKNEKRKTHADLRICAVPQAGEVVQPVRVVPGLARALRLLPGYQLAVRPADAPTAAPLRWEVATDAYNAHYLRCSTTGAVAYFILSENELRFTSYYGPRRAWLRELYLAAYRVPLCYLPAPTCAQLPPPVLRPPGLGWLQDLLAPFGQLVRPRYQLSWVGPEPGPAARHLHLRSTVALCYVVGPERPVQQAELRIENGALASLVVERPGRPALSLAFSEVGA